MIKILIVDDDVLICQVLQDFFELKGYKIFTAINGEDALKVVEKEKPHLVFLDIDLPDISGMQLLPEIKKIDSTAKVIVITGYSEEEKINEAKNKGASDYIIKPFSLAYLQENIMYKVYEQLFEDLRNEHQELGSTYEQIVFALAKILEEKDHYTKGHSERVANYSVEIAKELKLPEDEIRILSQASLLHDIGNISIEDTILNKQDELSDNEKEELKKHTLTGFEILNIIDNLKRHSTIIKYHHERVDGKGYPENKKGKEIPFLTKILTVADAYDAMTSNRPHRKGMLSPGDAINKLLENRGTQFESEVVDVFKDILIKKQIISNESFQ
ncbi:MAG: hypothetical protein A2539_02810 [Elusimicrobia bacterium RIFOXYD2_FULL_34_15]|nr:MAG: hypothetical protein A2539_02810 [Elusimicrobia bacterium RIFOXYD2_FULL_34_15]